MSTNWFKDMQEMHKKYGVNKWMQAEKQTDVDFRRFNKYMAFRLGMMQEELDETKRAFEQKDAPEMVDGIIDLCVFAIGTLEITVPLGLPDEFGLRTAFFTDFGILGKNDDEDRVLNTYRAQELLGDISSPFYNLTDLLNQGNHKKKDWMG